MGSEISRIETTYKYLDEYSDVSFNSCFDEQDG